MFLNVVSGKSGRHPGTTAHVVIDVCHLWQNSRNNLDSTWTIANHGNPLILSVCQPCGPGSFSPEHVLNSHILHPNERYAAICLWNRASLGFVAISSCSMILFPGWQCCPHHYMWTRFPNLGSDNVISSRPSIGSHILTSSFHLELFSSHVAEVTSCLNLI